MESALALQPGREDKEAFIKAVGICGHERLYGCTLTYGTIEHEKNATYQDPSTNCKTFVEKIK
ncbi:hypothetical protein [Paenibacillus terrae]|uniref:Uncharacterized protein n=1 Tax=Paenibacillus terrae TaxID=159743 RepID=A0A0D7WYG9_9BACL|nr:hypothetical protein [Paenibacillus terrae]KJD43753.1 hypothetical protein QD47_21070 [Paenibacillus terrae]